MNTNTDIRSQSKKRYILTETQLVTILEDKILKLIENDIHQKKSWISKRMTRTEIDELLGDSNEQDIVSIVLQTEPSRKRIFQVTEEQLRNLVLNVTMQRNSLSHLVLHSKA